MTADDRKRLAVIGGFTRPRDNIAHGTHHAAYIACEAIAATGAHSAIDVFHENAATAAKRAEVILPKAPPSRLLDKTAMPLVPERYQAIYIANGEQIGPSPYVLRPHRRLGAGDLQRGDDACRGAVGEPAGGAGQRAVRATDGFVFKSRAAERLFREVWTDWAGRLPGRRRSPRPRW